MSSLPDVNSHDILQPKTFDENFLTPLMKKSSHSAVVFLQDTLHMDDFTKYADVYSVDSTGGAFKNIKNLMDDNFSLELPQVSGASKAVDQLKSNYPGAMHSISSLDELDALGVSQDQPFLLLVHLPATAGNVDQEAAIAKNDDMIGAVCDRLKKKAIKYTALFTGKAASKGMVEEGEVHSGRHLLEADVVNKNGTFMNASDGNVYIFMRTISICVKNTSSSGDCVLDFDFVPDENAANQTVQFNGTARIILAFPNIKANNETSNPYNVSIEMEVIDQKDRWNILKVVLRLVDTENVDAENKTEIRNGSLINTALDFKVPILYSFHCTSMKLFLDALDNEYSYFKGTYVKFTGFQFQPFHIQNDRFYNSVDCVGFFTSGIWMGLVPVALLLTILLGGTMMLLNLSIMDRYDDPKGKTITVHTPGAD
ncbi:V-type proton ATPase subunit S1 isoform X2 [Aplysia californica]|nr:V-type proton ATPase subunit S1 isoform X2 [Aplysia californica]XP_035827020.1 V-type proton ATPase subunit S1 isoform X2 [Aplysia californica]